MFQQWTVNDLLPGLRRMGYAYNLVAEVQASTDSSDIRDIR